jgi:hypothetical protein
MWPSTQRYLQNEDKIDTNIILLLSEMYTDTFIHVL